MWRNCTGKGSSSTIQHFLFSGEFWHCGEKEEKFITKGFFFKKNHKSRHILKGEKKKREKNPEVAYFRH